ncbi:hypothetical protein [Vagococcus fluvialis]|uniref:hypothetical protein n=1 Tax=Vagococcus fluvialis TaxID=2738 RepID=UPI001A9010BE|nr:hypothetical protein [Vagococcus fluvialis]MBO0442721.1 hypothetical protein [Vagococcus fluvialis]
MGEKKLIITCAIAATFALGACSKSDNNIKNTETSKTNIEIKTKKQTDWSKYDSSWYTGMWVNPNAIDTGNRVLIMENVLAFSYRDLTGEGKYTGLPVNLDDIIRNGKIVMDESESEIFLLGAYPLSPGEFVEITPITEKDDEFLDNQKQIRVMIKSSDGNVINEKVRTEIKSLKNANEETKRIIEALEEAVPNDWSEKSEEKEIVESPIEALFEQKQVSYEQASDLGKAAISESLNYNLDYVDNNSFLVYEDVAAGEVYLAIMSNDMNPTVNGVVVYDTTTFENIRNIINVELKDDFGLLNEDMTIKK